MESLLGQDDQSRKREYRDKRSPRDSTVRINKSSRRRRGTNARELLIAYDRARLFIPSPSRRSYSLVRPSKRSNGDRWANFSEVEDS